MLRQLIAQYQRLEAIESINWLLGQHIADWPERNHPSSSPAFASQARQVILWADDRENAVYIGISAAVKTGLALVSILVAGVAV